MWSSTKNCRKDSITRAQKNNLKRMLPATKRSILITSLHPILIFKFLIGTILLLIGSLCEDEYFDEQLEIQVRESVDGEKETLEGLLNRILNDFKKPSISWLQFLGHFSKRGRLQGYNEIEVSPSKEKVQFLTMAEQGLSQVNA